MSGVSSCRPTKWRPAAVSQSQDIFGDGSANDGIAGTTTAAAALAFLGGGFESALGGAPWAAAPCTCCSRHEGTCIALLCNFHTRRTCTEPLPSPPRSSSRLGLLPQSLGSLAGLSSLVVASPLAFVSEAPVTLEHGARYRCPLDRSDPCLSFLSSSSCPA